MTERHRTLIVCPASLVYNWQSEIERFAPDLHPVMVTGDAASRKRLVEESTDMDILITSYDLLKRDIENYEIQNSSVKYWTKHSSLRTRARRLPGR